MKKEDHDANDLSKSYLLKFATMIGMGKVMHKTPQIAHRDATNLPAGVLNQYLSSDSWSQSVSTWVICLRTQCWSW